MSGGTRGRAKQEHMAACALLVRNQFRFVNRGMGSNTLTVTRLRDLRPGTLEVTATNPSMGGSNRWIVPVEEPVLLRNRRHPDGGWS
jgi:hypothetical protein